MSTSSEDALLLLMLLCKALGTACATRPTHNPVPLPPIFVFVGSRPDLQQFCVSRAAAVVK